MLALVYLKTFGERILCSLFVSGIAMRAAVWACKSWL